MQFITNVCDMGGKSNNGRDVQCDFLIYKSLKEAFFFYSSSPASNNVNVQPNWAKYMADICFREHQFLIAFTEPAHFRLGVWGQIVYACLMVERMAASSRWFKVREGGWGGWGGREEQERGKWVTALPACSWDGRTDLDVKEPVKALMGIIWGWW